MAPQLSIIKRARIIGMWEARLPLADILRTVGCCEKTALRWIDRYRRDGEKGLDDHRAKNRRPRKTTDEQDQRLIDALNADPSAAVSEVSAAINFGASERTARRRLKEYAIFNKSKSSTRECLLTMPTEVATATATDSSAVTVKMAAINSNLSSDIPAKKEDEFNEFYTEVKEIEKRDSVLTPKQQIDRLLRPGSSYFNLNPFEVLHIDPETTIDEVKKKYRRMSILVHPDKNQDDAERAQQAFEIVNKAWKTLENEETRAKCMDVIEEAKARTDHMIAEKKKKLKKEGKDGSAVPALEEETEEGYTHAVWVMTMKLFADMERRRRELATRDAEQRKRKREEELSAEAQAAMEKEWQRNFEESRQSRVDSWKAFQSGSGTATKQKKPKKMKAFRPPKTKAESR